MKYFLTYEPMLKSRDSVIHELQMILDGWINEDDPKNHKLLNYAIWYLMNDGAIREMLNLTPRFGIKDKQIVITSFGDVQQDVE